MSIFNEIMISLVNSISIKTMEYNVKFKQKLEPKAGNKKSPLSDSRWFCYNSMPDHQQRIHFERAMELYRNYMDYGFAPSWEETHDFFVTSRMSKGFVLGDYRQEPIWKNGKLIQEGLDPYLLPPDKCPAWLLDWNQGKNKIANDGMKEFIYG